MASLPRLVPPENGVLTFSSHSLAAISVCPVGAVLWLSEEGGHPGPPPAPLVPAPSLACAKCAQWTLAITFFLNVGCSKPVANFSVTCSLTPLSLLIMGPAGPGCPLPLEGVVEIFFVSLEHRITLPTLGAHPQRPRRSCLWMLKSFDMQEELHLLRATKTQSSCGAQMPFDLGKSNIPINP